MASGKRENDSRGGAMVDQSPEVDAAVLQYHNQKLVQQLEAQKSEMHALERKFKGLKDKQSSYDETLIIVNKIWNQLVDDLVLLGIQAGGDPKNLEALDHEECSITDMLESYAPEEIFLLRLLKASPVDCGKNVTMKYIQEALASRHTYTMDLMKQLQEIIASQQASTKSLALSSCGKGSSEGAITQICKVDDHMREVANKMRRAVDVLHQKHKQYADEINAYLDSHSKDQSEIKRLSGELEESMAELEESRRRLVVLQMQKHGTPLMNASVVNAVNGNNSLDKTADRTMGLRELKESVEEAKTLAASRLFELQEAQEDNLSLSKQLEDLQNELKDDNYVLSSKPYTVLNDRLQHMNAELGRYRGLIESLQMDRNHLLRREKELSAKAESADAVRSSIINYDTKIEELQLQIQKLVAEKNELEMKVEEAVQDSGRKDIKDEIHVMASTLSKEMEMMETQLNRSKEAACEALALRGEAVSLRAVLDRKNAEHKSLSDTYDAQKIEIKSLKALIEKMEKDKQELQIFLDMYGQECYDNRTVTEIKESENRARAQAEILQTALDEHSLELRVRAANEAEAACQQRLSTAEAEITELRAKVDASQRHLLEIEEAIRIKDAEAAAYITEIETIGQAYEDMQTQNQHLLQQVADRDDYNIKLVSDSVKMKQTISSLLVEKQAKAKQLQQMNSSAEVLKMKMVHSEEQMKAYIAQAIKTSIENRRVNINLDKSILELAEAEKELKWVKSAVDSADKEYEHNQKRIIELRKELERERNERKKLEEEYEEAKNEVMEMSSENEEAAIQRLQDEIKECKAILKCGVCFDRPKEVVITKCFHLFCSHCIQRNLEIRHRKCPGCGTPFGQSDVREVNI
ncbi:E3 ubiquitin-protein ligase BRE1-like 2 [Iris pallida]|uniref:E3 ubiquitin protein ligase n=1 Tax=Iris pallida TaxID=29817 RepID=A0AAX6F751_IRIPA|nr:E3 ubiquitin-protein ligase BRE1-like 2 [Iris pallida]